MDFLTLIKAAAALLVGTAVGYFLRQFIALKQNDSLELKAKRILLDAKESAQKVLDDAKSRAEKVLEGAKDEQKERERDLRRLEERITHKDETLERRSQELDKETNAIKEKVEKLRAMKENFEKIDAEKRLELEKVAKLSTEEAKEKLITEVEKKYESDILARVQKMERFGLEELERKARDILASTIQRIASSTASEVTVTSVTIPSDDLKGKIIGKEGRNIRALERAAGVEIIVDDTPGAILISSFDPVRRQIARVALENLILDGRIQPAKIEEMVEKAKTEIEKIIKDAGEKAIYEIGVFDIDPRLIMLLGRLKFRTSYGQNVLQHSIEMAHVAGMLASELKADVNIAKKGSLLHDIGKAVDHEIQGTHVEIGRRILQKFNVDVRIIQAMQSHHEEYPYETLESIIVQTADAISASRPGARRDSVENYVKRLEDLEGIATSFKGVEKAYAIQAGREIRVFVTPENLSDLEAKKMARDIADRIENELKYPGEIKVNVIREMRAIEYAR
ncbi:ribonuclease Y [Candidatus Giovannonibacteria bacterium RIFCSPHIGHO2_02_43_13]|uniref:Ribonuclease Y n=1 Tax=Candidatus Giovannonibacteria bacterium RIFCSPHIGHO2_02_43_13 TaxID=1798330 RepID=A0A1F5WQG5_9BACT|nr:MAG: Ribonuclease Y [Parcubacteria group bacterium GW2011_GWA2_44_13]OGF73971.1 MAG: ribonuclease Y [Candidatus Giovannonibacteria bacterium RIFCSPHIGHO2_12_FULL_44_42]OGF77860.1 MAG: ribonuclease Y [Candidatus Giovannonibacteria bacterium RIFCSPHIGHO2_02_43_13]OGF88803.1 MAG: ribonuclease Y [Candidatus Giovannonibacteria bacterium RIFCSPLOWO2_02_FULL_43_54]OGF96767.1 MAG: ribonuclease Y [Candidatus Giovannonibacteria bacterium RIFCSPLOWO2_12_FULL_44_32]